jgi:sortase A
MNPASSATKKPRKKSRRLARTAYYFFLVVGVFGLAYACYVFADAHAFQTVEQSRFENVAKLSRRGEPRHVVQGGVMGEMEVPRLGLKAVFVEGDSARMLRRAVGHISETALPGGLGNGVRTGHRDTFFRPLRNIRQGDVITLNTRDGNFQYQVEATAIVPSNDIQVLQSSNEPTLTLVTCFPFYFVGAAPKRFIVRARQVAASTEKFQLSE